MLRQQRQENSGIICTWWCRVNRCSSSSRGASRRARWRASGRRRCYARMESRSSRCTSEGPVASDTLNNVSLWPMSASWHHFALTGSTCSSTRTILICCNAPPIFLLLSWVSKLPLVFSLLLLLLYSLPLALRDRDISLVQFKKLLKTLRFM